MGKGIFLIKKRHLLDAIIDNFNYYNTTAFHLFFCFDRYKLRRKMDEFQIIHEINFKYIQDLIYGGNETVKTINSFLRIKFNMTC